MAAEDMQLMYDSVTLTGELTGREREAAAKIERALRKETPPAAESDSEPGQHSKPEASVLKKPATKKTPQVAPVPKSEPAGVVRKRPCQKQVLKRPAAAAKESTAQSAKASAKKH